MITHDLKRDLATHNVLVQGKLFGLTMTVKTHDENGNWLFSGDPEYVLVVPEWAAKDRKLMELCTEFIDAINETRPPSVERDREP